VYERPAGAYSGGREAVATDEFYALEEVEGREKTHTQGAAYAEDADDDDREKEASTSESDDHCKARMKKSKKSKKDKKNGKRDRKEKKAKKDGASFKRAGSKNRHIRQLMHGVDSEGDEEVSWPTDHRYGRSAQCAPSGRRTIV
jgi:hypothetical protein